MVVLSDLRSHLDSVDVVDIVVVDVDDVLGPSTHSGAASYQLVGWKVTECS